MVASLVLTGVTSVALILSVLFKPNITIKSKNVKIYALIPLIGGIFAVVFGIIDFNALIEKLTSSSSSNPIKIIVLFISMSLMSVLLDETGFFEYVASIIAKKAGKSQIGIFVSFYLTVSVLTVFTSNDVVILTFTPFICQFCKKVDIDPIPYVVTEFVGANTWSLLFLIGNPTNVFLSQAYGVTFFEYFLRMWLPTIFCGVSSFFTLLAIFWKKLQKPVYRSDNDVKLKDKTSAVISLAFLFATTLLIAISSYVNVEMWFVSLIAAVCQYGTVTLYKVFTKSNCALVKKSVSRAPWEMIPLVFGMFILVASLSFSGATKQISNLIGEDYPIIKYGVLSTIFANVTNNIPMSVLFSSIAAEMTNVFASEQAVYATIIGSNVGAFLTPIGALAGIMFTSIVKDYYSDFGFKKFMKYGSIIVLVSLVFGLIGLRLSYLLF